MNLQVVLLLMVVLLLDRIRLRKRVEEAWVRNGRLLESQKLAVRGMETMRWELERLILKVVREIDGTMIRGGIIDDGSELDGMRVAELFLALDQAVENVKGHAPYVVEEILGTKELRRKLMGSRG